MRIILFLLLLSILPKVAFAQCVQEDAYWLDSFIDWVYRVFGDRILKVFGCLYGLSLVFKITGILLDKFVLMTTWTDRDNILFKKVSSHWLYRVVAIVSELFLRLKLPKSKIR
jgi:hypothetical protein